MPLDAQVDLLREHHHEAGAETHEHIRAQPRRLMARLPLIADDAAEHAGEHQAQQELALADLRHPSASSHISCPYYTTTNVSRHLSAQEKICLSTYSSTDVDNFPRDLPASRPPLNRAAPSAIVYNVHRKIRPNLWILWIKQGITPYLDGKISRKTTFSVFSPQIIPMELWKSLTHFSA